MKSPQSVSSSVLLLTPSGAKRCDTDGQFLAVHYLHLCRVRHWVSQEVFLDPNLLMIKVYASIANIGIDYIPASYPTAGVFGAALELPAAFINGEAAGTAKIISYLRSIVDVDKNIKNSFSEEREAIQTGASRVLHEAIHYALYGQTDCFAKFTTPIMRDSLPRIYAKSFCSERQREWINRDRELISSRLWNVVKEISNKLGWTSSRKFLFDDHPSVCDIALYSYLSILMSIPEHLTPYHFLKHGVPDDVDEVIQRIKSYLLDFDDWLWQINAKRSDESAGLLPLLPSAANAAKGTGEGANEVEEEQEESPTEKERSFLGEQSDVRKSNTVFLACSALTMVAIGLLI